MTRFVDDAKPIRFHPELVERAKRLQAAIARDPEVMATIGRMSPSAVLRLAAVEGLRLLERRYGKEEP